MNAERRLIMSQSERLAQGCPACGHLDWGIGTAKTATGSTVHPYYCRACGKHTQQYASKRVAEQAGGGNRIRLKSEGSRFCVVCGAVGAEEHHWAPRFLFGDEADRWPTALLCVPCHLRWHNTVTPSMSAKP